MSSSTAISYAKRLIPMAIDWRARAYTPYSLFKVGAVMLADNEKIYGGANVENASYGLSCCAERVAIYNGICNGAKYIVALAVVADTDGPVSMCGACRQVAVEFMNKDSILICSSIKESINSYKIWSAQEVLPDFFNKENL